MPEAEATVPEADSFSDPDPDPFSDGYAHGFAYGYAHAHAERDADSLDSFGPSDPFAVGFRIALAILDAELEPEPGAERVSDGGPGPGADQLPLFESDCGSDRCSVCSDGRTAD